MTRLRGLAAQVQDEALTRREREDAADALASAVVARLADEDEQAAGLHLLATEDDVGILVLAGCEGRMVHVPIDNPHSCILDTTIRCLACEGIGLRLDPPRSAPPP